MLLSHDRNSLAQMSTHGSAVKVMVALTRHQEDHLAKLLFFAAEKSSPFR